MGVITISLDEKSEKKLRDSAKIIYGDKKGALSKTIMKAVNKLKKERKQDIEEALRILNDPIEIKNKYKGKKLPSREKIWEDASRKIIPDKKIKEYHKRLKKEKR